MQIIYLFKKLLTNINFINGLLLLTILVSLVIVASNVTLSHLEVDLFWMLLLLVSFSALGFILSTKRDIGKISTILLATTFIMFGFVAVLGNPLFVSYYEDCHNISDIAIDEYDIFISDQNCINYITENPNSTGAEMIDFFVSEKKVENSIKNDVLERPPMP